MVQVKLNFVCEKNESITLPQAIYEN
jgi:hypothetical protein